LFFTRQTHRRKEDEKVTAETESKKRKAPAKQPAKKKKLKTDDDEKLAKSLAGRRSSARDRDANRAKSKKAAALAALKKQRQIQQDLVEESSSDGSEMDYGDSDEDSDEEYEEADLKPWQKKKAAKAAAAAASRLDQDDGSDMDIDEEEDDDAAQAKQRRAGASKSLEADAGLEDFLKVTIPRRRLARWCNEPYFEAAVLECFVRLFIGEDDKENKVYRLCEIVDVLPDKKSYKFPTANRNETPITTNKMLKLKFGNSEKAFPMSLVSDAIPTEMDVQKYITTQRNIRSEVLSKRRATKLRRVQDNLINNYVYTTEDIEKNLQHRKKLGKSLANLGAEQTKVAIAVQGAKASLQEAEKRLADTKKAILESTGDASELNDLEKSVDECKSAVDQAKKHLEEKLQEEKTLDDIVKSRKQKLTGRQKDQNWAKVNQRALQINQKADREGYKAQLEAEARKAAGEKEKFNPYARRRVKPKVLWEVGQAKDQEAESKDEEEKDSREDTPSTAEPAVEISTPALVHENGNAAALLSETHQFAIDEEGLVQSSVLGGYGSGGAKNAARTRERKGLSLNEYLERKSKGTL